MKCFWSQSSIGCRNQTNLLTTCHSHRCTLHSANQRCPFDATPNGTGAAIRRETDLQCPRTLCRFFDCPSSVATKSISSRRRLALFAFRRCLLETSELSKWINHSSMTVLLAVAGVTQHSSSMLGHQSWELQIQRVPGGACSTVLGASAHITHLMQASRKSPVSDLGAILRPVPDIVRNCVWRDHRRASHATLDWIRILSTTLHRLCHGKFLHTARGTRHCRRV